MIDWLSIKMNINHNHIMGDRLLKISNTGEVIYQLDQGISYIGSYDSSIYLTTTPDNHLYFSGNPVKFLQGHNIFGSMDITSMVYDCLRYINSLDDVNLNLDLFALPYVIDFSKPTRIDITQSFTVGSRARVRNFIRALEFKSKTRHGRSQLSGTTLYYGKNSRRWSIKIYSKADELESRKKGHKLPHEHFSEKNIERLQKYANDLIRIELTLRGKELEKRSITTLEQLDEQKCSELYEEYMMRIEISDQIKLDDEQLINLPPVARGTYTMWRDGYDLRSILTKTSYYRHRKQLRALGIDIAIRRDIDNQFENILPFIQVIKAEPVGIPDWAFDEGLVSNA